MKHCYRMQTAKALFVAFIVFAILPQSAVAMTSTNYHIESDAISGGGVTYAQSTNYGIGSTLGEFFATSTTSTNYAVLGGFWQTAVEGNLSLAVSKSSIALGTLSVNSVSSDSLVATVTSTASRGYTLVALADGNLRSGGSSIANVSDGSVSTGSEEYGMTTSGADGQYNATDTSVPTTAYKTIAQNNDPASGTATTVTFKAGISSGTTAGSYSQSVSLILTANF